MKGTERENPGFDAVVGNPPYGNLGDINYLRVSFPITRKNLDVYVAFIEQALAISARQGWVSYIIPVAWQTGINYAAVRQRLLDKSRIYKFINLPFDVFPEAYIDTCVVVLQNAPPANDATTRVFTFPKKAKVDDLSLLTYQYVRQADWQGGKGTIVASPSQLSFLRKLEEAHLTQGLGKLTDSARGVLAGPSDIADEPSGHAWKPFFDGEFNRYVMDVPHRYVRYGDNLQEHPALFDFFDGERLLIRRLVNRQDRLMATVATETFVNKKDIYNFKVTSPAYHTLFLLAAVNSPLLSFAYLQQDVAATKDDFRQTTLEGLRTLPIRCIAFTTPEKERTQLLDKGKKLYERCLAKGDQACVLGFVEHALKQIPEQADVVHDLLAFLAEQMIEANKAKQAEVKGFLGWLEREIGAKVDDLKNKTKLKYYHDGTFEVLLEVLKENHRAFSVNPSERKFQDRLAREYTDSLAKLGPLKTRLEAIDRLIDQIVYRLYGLTEEEVKLVEGKSS